MIHSTTEEIDSLALSQSIKITDSAKKKKVARVTLIDHFAELRTRLFIALGAWVAFSLFGLAGALFGPFGSARS